MNSTQSEKRLAVLVDERELVHGKHEQKLAEIATRDDKNATHADKELLRGYREQLEDYDREIGDLASEVERNAKALEESKAIRRVLAGGVDGVEADEDGGVAYRTMAEFARDFIITRQFQTAGMIAAQVDKEVVQRAAERLQMVQRAPTNTLSSNVGGLIPPQHISQIFQVINKSRPLVETAQRADLVRGTITYPSVDTKPVVAVQGSEKTEGGTTGMAVSMVTATASTYIGGGDLSWQAINWSTPNALDLWFNLIAADYALKTETDAATVVSAQGFLHKISSTIGATPTFAEFMTAVGAGAAKVYADSGRIADTVYMAPDRYWYVFGTTSSAFAQFTTVTGDGVGPLRFVQSRGLNAGEIIVGDSQGLLVAETPGAPVELRVVEPSIGGVEVGLIGAFEAVVVDAGAFSEITTAS
jgi:HK97 family phage major capsid protein